MLFFKESILSFVSESFFFSKSIIFSGAFFKKFLLFNFLRIESKNPWAYLSSSSNFNLSFSISNKLVMGIIKSVFLILNVTPLALGLFFWISIESTKPNFLIILEYPTKLMLQGRLFWLA